MLVIQDKHKPAADHRRSQSQPQHERKGFFHLRVREIVLFLAVAIMAATLIHVVDGKRPQVAGAETKRVEQNEDTLNKLSEIMYLPSNEKPSIATIVDVQKLKTNTGDFYSNAVNGDILIIYSNKAIIFRADKKYIVNVASIIAKNN